MDNSLSRPLAPSLTQARTSSLEWRARLVCLWFERVAAGALNVTFPSGQQRSFSGPEPGPNVAMVIHDLRVVGRVMRGGDLGFAEGYMAGEWDTPDLTALLRFGALNSRALAGALHKAWPARLLGRIQHALRANTRRGSRRNIAAHYDLGNRFYGHWLDDSMTYSAALFRDMSEPLADAQRRKYLRLAAELDLQPGDRVLEIGCGWGGFAEIAAAEFGCRVVALTLSHEQARYARARMARAGVADKVEVRLQDYRDVAGRFDKIVSIEMFEAVGEKYWPVYLNTLRQRLRPGGRAALQVITMDDQGFADYRRNPEFIQRYIFPGGMLPGPRVFTEAVDAAGLAVVDHLFFGPSYAETLRRWDRDFQQAWPEIQRLGFDARFYRMWRYYLCYCEAGFDSGRIDVAHFTLEHR